MSGCGLLKSSLEKCKIMAPFLKKYYCEGRSLSNPKNLGDYHVPKDTETFRKILGDQTLFWKSEFLKQPNNYQCVAPFVNATIQTHDRATSFIFHVNDSISYCPELFFDTLPRLCPKMIRVWCWAQIIDLLGDIWQ